MSLQKHKQEVSVFQLQCHNVTKAKELKGLKVHVINKKKWIGHLKSNISPLQLCILCKMSLQMVQ